MKKLFALSVFLLAATMSFAADGAAAAGGMGGSVSVLGAGLAVIGAGIGIGMVGGRAMEAIARQPKAVGDIRANMIVAAALIEGAALFAIVVSLLK